MTKSGFIAIIGKPNVGKSTLINQIVGTKVAITTYKPQTTRYDIRCIYNDDRGQLVFTDTPGFHKAKNALGRKMISTIMRSMQDCDVILWTVESADFISATEEQLVKEIKKLKKPVILAINKIDKISNVQLLPIIDNYKKIYDFDEIVPIAARTGKNVDTLIDQIFKYVPYGEKFFDDDALTDQPVRQIVAELIREKALIALNDEIPHGIAVVIDQMSERDNDLIDIEAIIICEKSSHKGIIIGKHGDMLKNIGSRARLDIEKLLDAKVNLQLWVKVKNNWRDNESAIKSCELFLE